MANETLGGARRRKDDEFYTPLPMIEAELEHYDPALFRGKAVLCNCDDPGENNNDEGISEFFRYFDMHFCDFGLRQLVGVRFCGSSLFPGISGDAAAYSRMIVADKNGGKHSTKRRMLKGGGGFETAECVELLRAADIVVTNPPFSRFREFVKLLTDENKQFLIIGNLNAVSYKQIFPLIKDGKIWLGVSNCKQGFRRPDGGESKLGFARWFTNLPHEWRQNEELILTAKYNAGDYPHYDNWDAIEVAQVKDIPSDYDGDMGVPITFLEKHNPHQFEIVGLCWLLLQDRGDKNGMLMVGGTKKYRRVIIRRKK